MVDINREIYERNVIETIVDNDGILCLNEKHIEERLDHKDLREITVKYDSDHRKQKYEYRYFIYKKLALKLIMDCRTTSAHKFRTILGLKQYDVILTKEQSVITKLMS